jgi:hypothetical protein
VNTKNTENLLLSACLDVEGTLRYLTRFDLDDHLRGHVETALEILHCRVEHATGWSWDALEGNEDVVFDADRQWRTSPEGIWTLLDEADRDGLLLVNGDIDEMMGGNADFPELEQTGLIEDLGNYKWKTTELGRQVAAHGIDQGWLHRD